MFLIILPIYYGMGCFTIIIALVKTFELALVSRAKGTATYVVDPLHATPFSYV